MSHFKMHASRDSKPDAMDFVCLIVSGEWRSGGHQDQQAVLSAARSEQHNAARRDHGKQLAHSQLIIIWHCVSSFALSSFIIS